VTALLLAVLIAAPAAGTLTVLDQSARLQHRILQMTVGVWLTATLGWLTLVTFDGVSPAIQIVIARLVELEAGTGEVALSVALTPVRAGFLLSGLVLLLPMALRSVAEVQAVPPDGLPGRPSRLLPGVLSVGAVAILSDNLMLVLAAWLLLDSLLIRFVECQPVIPSASESEQSAHNARWVLTSVLRLSSIALMIAVLLAATRYHSASLSGFIEAAAQDERIDAGMVRGGILVWFALAVASRAALFPAGIWLRPLAESGKYVALPLFAWVAALPAIAVWSSLSPLLSLEPESCLLVSLLCGFSGVVIGTIALGSRSQTQARLLLLLSITGAFTLMSVTVSALADASSGIVLPATSAIILLANSAAIAILSVPARHNRSGLLAAGVLLSGLAGPNFLLDALQSLRHTQPHVTDVLEATATSPHTTGSEFVTGLWCSVCLTQFLIGAMLALKLNRDWNSKHTGLRDESVQSVQRCRAEDSAVEESSNVPGYAVPMLIVLSVLSCVLFVSASDRAVGVGISRVTELSESTLPATPMTLRSLMSFNAATLSGLLGAVCIWLFLRLPVDVRHRLSGSSASLKRLARTWFYVGVAVESLRLVAGWAMFAVELLDRRLLGGQRDDAWRASALRVGRTIEEIGAHGSGYPSLAALLAVVGVLLALAGFGR
jgi:hypothetical protein